MSALPIRQEAANSPKVKGGANNDEIGSTVTAEIVIALCGPMGTPLHEVASVFQRLLTGQEYMYESAEIIRLSALIRELANLPSDASIDKLIDSGNDLRKNQGPEVLARKAIEKIALVRGEFQKAENPAQANLFTPEAIQPSTPRRNCHIIDSIKNPQELRLLRAVYGDMLHVIGVYSPIELRIERLSKKNSIATVHHLIDRDSGEEVDHGQQVRDIFPLADFFLRADTNTTSQLDTRVARFLDLMLGTRIITPTPQERAMYAAYSAARNSACLSRQVGAALTNADGEIISTGWNDVPRAFGGLYQSTNHASTDDDHRCWNKDNGKCFNDEEKAYLSVALVNRLIAQKIVDESKREEAETALRKDSQLKGLIEFSRAVHAEMHALLNAANSHGHQIRGGKLFVTTYPCHSCARHIVAAGIKEVYFVEPYRKSLAAKLHSDAITENESDDKKVRIRPFDGVAPTRFLKFFSAPASGRKDSNGRMRPGDRMPVTAISLEAVATLEALAVRPLHSD